MPPESSFIIIVEVYIPVRDVNDFHDNSVWFENSVSIVSPHMG